MTPDLARARRMLAELRVACFVIFLLAVAAMAWHDARPVLISLIALCALAPIIAQADEPDPGEGLPEGCVCETCGTFIDPQGGRR